MLFRSRTLFFTAMRPRGILPSHMRRSARRAFGALGSLALLRGMAPPVSPSADDLREAQKILMLAAIGLD